jgi:hypothetical protein
MCRMSLTLGPPSDGLSASPSVLAFGYKKRTLPKSHGGWSTCWGKVGGESRET